MEEIGGGVSWTGSVLMRVSASVSVYFVFFSLIFSLAFADEITNHIGMKMVLISAGEFLMGTKQSAKRIAVRYGGKGNWFMDEKPYHRVVITKPFYMCRYEVTQSQYEKIMGVNPSYSKSEEKPVEQVSWMDAGEFCKRLSRKEGATYRLPTEAEWEYACRAGTTSNFFFGNDEERLGEYAWFRENANGTCAVGRKEANAWGIHDMFGNVWEWCNDVYGEYTQKAGILKPFISVKDPQGANSGSRRVLRGGGWNSPVYSLRCATRLGVFPEKKTSFYGFRCVREYHEDY